jgi:hypothetical protein
MTTCMLRNPSDLPSANGHIDYAGLRFRERES